MRNWTKGQKRLIRKNYRRLRKELEAQRWARVWVPSAGFGNWAAESFVVHAADLLEVRCW